MNHNAPALELLKTYFGFDEFLPLQEDIIANVMAKKDTLVLMPTGGGKSLCYQLPALHFDGLTLVVSPLIALMKDQVDSLKANGIAAEFINSTLPRAEIARVQNEARQGGVKILYLAPERLAQPDFRGFLRTLDVSLIAIDEAHCISEWGHDFRPDYRNLKSLRHEFSNVPVIALTATATEKVREDIVAQLDLQKGQTFISSFNRANLSYIVEPKTDPFSRLYGYLQKHKDKPAIVYCFSRKDTEALAYDLSEQGLKALPYHAGLNNSVRRETQEKFIRDEVPIVTATIAFGMGIDKPDIRLVVHYDLPKSLEGYYQETGRAGRDGLPSECVLFYSYRDKSKQDFFIDQITDKNERDNAREKLSRMVEFCELQVCRRKYVLEYFGEDWSETNCGSCDVCLASKEEFDATIISQKVMSAVIRTGERFGANHVIEVLRGARKRKIRELEHDKLSVYGIVRDHSEEDLKQIVGLLLEKGLVAKDGDKYPTLSVTAEGRTFLKNREKLTLTRLKRADKTARRDSGQEYDQGLFDKLRELRKRIADERDVPPFIVFGDAALQQMAYYYPQTRENFSRISGVGKSKLVLFSDDFLSVIRQHISDNGLTERPILQRPRSNGGSPARSRASSTYVETRALVVRRVSIEDMAEQRGLTAGTIISHIEKLADDDSSIDIGYLMPSARRLNEIGDAFKSAGGFNLIPVREVLGDSFSYRELRLVRIYLRQGNKLLN